MCFSRIGHLTLNVSSGRMSLWTAANEEKRKSKSNIVCLCGLQWVCFSRIGHLTLNVSSGRMSLWTAATKKRENLKAILYVFADCNDCVCVLKCRRSDSKCFFSPYVFADRGHRSYVFVDCGYEEKRKSKSNIVCLCGLQWLCVC